MRRKSIAAVAMAVVLSTSLVAGAAVNAVAAEEMTEEAVIVQEETEEPQETAAETEQTDGIQELAAGEEELKTEEDEKTPAAEDGDAPTDGVAFDETNFPDANFRAKIAQYDKDKDGVFSQAELDAVTKLSIDYANIEDLTGIKNFRKLYQLSCYKNNLKVLDLSGMQELYDVRYDYNDNLTTVDFRNCPKLYSAYHAAYQEVVYISAGMTRYIGCQYVDEHTGNIVIDLDGYYTLDADNNKLVDFDAVMSPHLIEVFEFDEHENYDKTTHVLTIPAVKLRLLARQEEIIAVSRHIGLSLRTLRR